jgi:hypothetical protein
VRVADTIAEADRHHLSQSGERSLHVRLERQRGLKSFLTWAFFLAQLSAAEQLLTGAAKAQEDEFAGTAAKPSEAPSDSPLDQTAAGKAAGAEAESVASSPPGSSTIQLPPLDDDMPAPIHPHFASPAAPSTSSQVGGAASGSAAHARGGSSSSPDHSLPTSPSDLIAQTPPVHADVSLTSLLGFEFDIDAGGLISANIDLDLGNLLVAPLQEVTELVGSLTDDLGTLLNGPGLALTEDVGNLLSGTGLALGETLDTVVSNLSSSLSELTGLNLTDGLAGLLEGGSTDAPDQGGDTASDQISDAASGASNVQTDELFIEGRYTEYNIALRDGPELIVDQPSVIEPSTADVPPSEPPAQADQPPPDSTIAELLSLDEFATRPTV